MLGRTQTEDKNENKIVKAVIVPNCCIGTNIDWDKTPKDKTVVIAAPNSEKPVFFTVLLTAFSKEWCSSNSSMNLCEICIA